jgi:tetratricopeptide (TPR) repeat protein
MAAGPVVFISYSHDSDERQDKVLGLAERLRQDGVEARIDQYVEGTPEQGWPRWMLYQLDEADFVLVVCTETYYRRFRGHEEPGKGKGADWEGALITQASYDARSRTVKFVPVVLAAGQEAFIPEPLREHTHYELTSEESYQALYAFLLGEAGVEPGEVGETKPVGKRVAKPLRFGPTTDRRVAVSHLRHAATHLFGREKELADLAAAWADPAVHVVTLVAWGGVGKTSLVARWVAGLAARDHDGADYFDWSFYSQGTREKGGASADAFVDAALRFFGDAAMADSPRSPWDKGARLAQLVAERRALLVLDGLEPLQHPPGPLAGELQDPAMAALLKGLAARNPGLYVVTTRERIKDLAAFEESTAPQWPLEHLSVEAGVHLLEDLGVHGGAAELKQLVVDVRGHALTLNLIGRFLVGAHGGDVRKRDLVRIEVADAEVQGGHAFRVMEAYERWLVPKESLWRKTIRRLRGAGLPGASEGRLQLAILRLLGLFDRPASADCLAALRRPPVIPGLTESVVAASEAQWNLAVSRLADCGLVVADEGGLDAHPLVREHFARRLREQSHAAWKAAHGRLFDHLKDTTEYRPDSLAGLQPLYQAVAHGCRAGREQEACDEVYRERILRGTETYGFYSTRNLGAFGADLAAVACFFELPWRRVSPALSEAGQAWLLHQAAYRLRALGRLTEAVEPMRAGLEGSARLKDWGNAAVDASNLSELEMTLGDLAGSLRDSEQAVFFADRSGDPVQRVSRRTTLAHVLHQAGSRAKALERFREAEAMQAEWQPEFPLLYSLRASSTVTCSSPAPSGRPQGGRRIAALGRLATRGSGGDGRCSSGGSPPIHYSTWLSTTSPSAAPGSTGRSSKASRSRRRDPRLSRPSMASAVPAISRDSLSASLPEPGCAPPWATPTAPGPISPRPRRSPSAALCPSTSPTSASTAPASFTTATPSPRRAVWASSTATAGGGRSWRTWGPGWPAADRRGSGTATLAPALPGACASQPVRASVRSASLRSAPRRMGSSPAPRSPSPFLPRPPARRRASHGGWPLPPPFPHAYGSAKEYDTRADTPTGAPAYENERGLG